MSDNETLRRIWNLLFSDEYGEPVVDRAGRWHNDCPGAYEVAVYLWIDDEGRYRIDEPRGVDADGMTPDRLILRYLVESDRLDEAPDLLYRYHGFRP
jgi:hypothetical protein